MISNNQLSFKKTDPVYMTEFIRLERDSELKVKERKSAEEPPPPEKRPPPPPMQMQQAHVSQSDAPQMDMPNLDIPLQTDRFSGSLLSGLKMGVNLGQRSMNKVPLVRVDPRYPRKAMMKRTEGWVKVLFTITKEGTVKDAKVVGAQPKNIFNRSALRAVKRYKYKPEIVNGVAVEVLAGVVINFSLKKNKKKK